MQFIDLSDLFVDGAGCRLVAAPFGPLKGFRQQRQCLVMVAAQAEDLAAIERRHAPVARWAGPKSYFKLLSLDYWRLIFWGIRVTAGRADLATHKKLQNLMERASYADKSLFRPVIIEPDDYNKGVPVRMIWSKNMYRRLSYAEELGLISVPTLVMVGRYDPEAPIPCSEELVSGIFDARLKVFEKSGHAPFIEEPVLFRETLQGFYEEIR